MTSSIPSVANIFPNLSVVTNEWICSLCTLQAIWSMHPPLLDNFFLGRDQLSPHGLLTMVTLETQGDWLELLIFLTPALLFYASMPGH